MSDPENEAADKTPSLDGRDITEEEVFTAHEGGKLSIAPTVGLAGRRDLAIAYTPGVAKVCRAIADDKALTARYTWTHRLVAVVSDGTAVLGLGDIGPRASLPVMEGKSALFKAFADLDSIPLVLDTTDVDEIVDTIVHLRPSFGAVNLEDIAAPRCFELERRLIEALDCPVMHDDQHGTAIVVLAALRDAARGPRPRPRRAQAWSSAGPGPPVSPARRSCCWPARTTWWCSTPAASSTRAATGMNVEKIALAEITNPRGVRGDLADALDGADVFLGLSGSTVPESADRLDGRGRRRVRAVQPRPRDRTPPSPASTPRSSPPGAATTRTRSTTCSPSPACSAGALDAAARRITEAMKLAAAEAIADIAAGDDEFGPDHIVPSALDPRVAPAVAEAVARAAAEEGVVRRHVAEVAVDGHH